MALRKNLQSALCFYERQTSPVAEYVGEKKKAPSVEIKKEEGPIKEVISSAAIIKSDKFVK